MTRRFAPARVVSCEGPGDGYHLLTLEASHLAQGVAGSFAMISPRPRAAPGTDLSLLRPFSFLSRTPALDQVEIFFREVGCGTRALGKLRPGEILDTLGPLGRGFSRPPAGGVVLLAGGVGMPPLLDLAAELGEEHEVVCYYGGRGRSDLHFFDRFEAAGVQLVACTDDGSLGCSGTNIDAFRETLGGPGDLPATVVACGPTPMLRAARALCQEVGLALELSLEANMACGIGVCRGCAVRRGGGSGYAMVCEDGPVFPASEVRP